MIEIDRAIIIVIASMLAAVAITFVALTGPSIPAGWGRSPKVRIVALVVFLAALLVALATAYRLLG